MISRDKMSEILDVLCPMYVLLDSSAHICRVGPTLQKLRPDEPMGGRRFLELFELDRPRALRSFQDLLDNIGAKLHLKFRDDPRTSLKGTIVPLPDGEGAIVNLSFGISVLDAVRDYALNSADFSATDLTIELLYLVEAKSAAMDASRTLNKRLQKMMVAAEEQAFTDTLTGLENRRALDSVLERKIITEAPFYLMNLDLDYFKKVNDTLGHAAGDHVLQHVAKIMIEEIRDVDVVARAGGDEFVFIFDNLSDPQVIERIAKRLIERLEEPIPWKSQTCNISASVGISFWRSKALISASELLHMADLALYAAKHAGRGCHRFFDPSMMDGNNIAVNTETGAEMRQSTNPDLKEIAPEPGQETARVIGGLGS